MHNDHSKLNQSLLSWLNSTAALIACISCIGIFYIGTLVDGQNWSGDFSHYLHHAINIVEGRNYSDTQYLVNSIGFFVGPYNYPPIYPILLAPVYWCFGFDLEAFKWVSNLSFLAALWFAALCFQKRLTLNILLPVLLIALNPYLWGFRNNILSDFTFTAFCFLALYLMLAYFEREEQASYDLKQQLLHSILIGVCCYLAYGTREIGIVAPLTFIAYDIVGRRKLSLASVVVTGTFISLAMLQSHLLSESFVPQYIQDNLSKLAHERSSVSISHTKWISTDPAAIMERVKTYRWALQNFIPEHSGNGAITSLLVTVSKILFNLTTLLALIGYIRCLLLKLSVLEIFLAGYISVLLLFGAPATVRYLIPVFPFLVYYSFIAFQWASNLINKRTLVIGVAGYSLMTGLVYVTSMASASYERFEKGITHQQAEEMFDYIRKQTNTNDSIVFRKPRVMSLYTGRTSAAYPNPETDIPNLIDNYFDAIEGDYYVDMNLEDWMLPLEDSAPPSAQFQQVFRNTYFAIYRYSPGGNSNGEASNSQPKILP